MLWERPKTIKLYLHVPKSQRYITLWPDFKVIDREFDPPDPDEPAAYGVRFLFGEQCSAPDWQQTVWHVRSDGIPVHAIHTTQEDLEAELEAFSSWDEPARTYLKLTLTNPTPMTARPVIGIMARSAADWSLMGTANDFYSSYVPRLEHWDCIPNTWSGDERQMGDGSKRISISLPEGATAVWRQQNPLNQFAKNYLHVKLTIGGQQSETIWLCMSDSATPVAGQREYEQELAEVVRLWEHELEQVRIVPDVDDENIQAMFSSLIGQNLQMFATGKDGLVRPCQGGRVSGVWPTEAVEFLVALDRAGLSEWSEQGYNFFSHYQVTEGDDRGRICSADSPTWACSTGMVIYGLGYHLISRNDREYFQRWRNLLLGGLGWIERQRAQTKARAGELGFGLFPACKAHDWGIKARFWCFTDGLSYMGVRRAAEVFEHFGDPEAARVRAVADDYEKCLRDTLEMIYEPQEGQEEVYIPNILGAEDVYPPVTPYFLDGPVSLLRAGIISPNSNLLLQIECYFLNRGWMKNGLNGLMTNSRLSRWGAYDPWMGHTWYTSFPDMPWFHAWLARGEREKAAQILWAQMKYAMTPEYYMQERYADNDPTFCPWQPNASANGRMMMMLLDFYGERSTGV